MSAPYLPPCFCEVPAAEPPASHLPGCPHYDSAHDPPALAGETARIYWSARPVLGCECGARMHEGETHEAALACEDVEARTGCSCGGYYVEGEVLHDGLCDLAPWPSLTDSTAG